jgi:hypothetical protein
MSAPKIRMRAPLWLFVRQGDTPPPWSKSA